MGKITKTKVITNKINVHIFYCDSCQKKIAECEDCKAKFKNKLIKSLMNLGFEVKK